MEDQDTIQPIGVIYYYEHIDGHGIHSMYVSCMYVCMYVCMY